ncbi:TetR/AcrR family transcriptional regulator [Streptomyces sp. NPDC002643]
MPATSNDPRARRSRAAALAATTQLLIEGGPAAVTHAAVAERAGVGRATLYRHWPDVQSLLLDALTSDARPLFTVTDGPIRDVLIDHLKEQANWLNQPVSASVIATVMERAERDEDVRHIREEMFGHADELFATVLATAAERGELRPGAEENARDIVSHFLGPLFFQRFMLGVRLDDEMVVRAVDHALAPWLPSAQPPDA